MSTIFQQVLRTAFPHCQSCARLTRVCNVASVAKTKKSLGDRTTKIHTLTMALTKASSWCLVRSSQFNREKFSDYSPDTRIWTSTELFLTSKLNPFGEPEQSPASQTPLNRNSETTGSTLCAPFQAHFSASATQVSRFPMQRTTSSLNAILSWNSRSNLNTNTHNITTTTTTVARSRQRDPRCV